MTPSLTDQAAQLTSKLNSVLDWVGTNGQDATDFLKAEAPLVANEIVAFTFWESTLWAVLNFLFILLLLSLCVFVVRKIMAGIDPKRKWDHDDSIACSVLLIILISAIVAPIFFASVVPRTIQAVKCKTAPRLVVIDKITELVNRK